MTAFGKIASRSCKLGGIIITLGILTHLALRITAFVHIFFEHAGILLSQEEILQSHPDDDGDTRQPVVPRITHQIFHNWTHPEDETLPDDWIATRQTCLDVNNDWVHHLWTTKSSEDFIAEEYPWFLPTYSRFNFPVQKIDALRYFLMRHYGGIYIDLDNGCKSDLEPLRYYPAWTTDGGCGALSNNILGAEPNHPYWIEMTDSIIPHAWNYPLPYLTISYATGQWYLTKIWEEFHQQLTQNGSALTRVSMDGREGGPPWVFFTQARGGTWDNWDNLMFSWIGDHLGVVALLIIVVCSLSALSLSLCMSAVRRQYGRRYELVQNMG